MNSERLERLLRQTLQHGPREPLSPQCLKPVAIRRLLNRPEEAARDDLRHLADCPYCQWAVMVARRHRAIIAAPWSDQPAMTPADTEQTACVTPVATGPRRLRITPRVARFSLLAAAAVMVLAVGWWSWSTSRPELLGPLRGSYVSADAVRGTGEPERMYRVTVDVRGAGYLTFLYLDYTRRLKLPSGATAPAESVPAGGHREFTVTVTHDPPGPQWIVAVASKRPFDPVALRDELQAVLTDLPNRGSVDASIERLERALRGRRELSFVGQRFVVGGGAGP